MPRQKVKKVTLNIRLKSGSRKLNKLLADGWVIQSQHKRGALEWKPGQVDYVLTKQE